MATTREEFRELAREHGAEALDTLVAIMTGAGSETARIAAAREILDRAYGKTAVPLPDPPAGNGTITIQYVNDWRDEAESEL